MIAWLRNRCRRKITVVWQCKPFLAGSYGYASRGAVYKHELVQEVYKVLPSALHDQHALINPQDIERNIRIIAVY